MSSNKNTAGLIAQISTFVAQVLRDMKAPFKALDEFASNSEKVKLFKEGVQKLLEELLVLNPFRSEVVKQAWFYPKGWKSASVEALKARLAELFRRIDLSQIDRLVNSVKRSRKADGVWLIPKLSYLGELWGINDPYGSGYVKILEKLFELISANRSFVNYRVGEMNERHIRINAEVREKLQKMEAETPGDVLVLAGNFGNIYAGWSPRAARWEALNNKQFPFLSAQVACLLLLMPDRLTAWEQLFIDCSGDEWDLDADGSWLRCPYLSFYGGRLEFDTRDSGSADGCYGSAVAFLGSAT